MKRASLAGYDEPPPPRWVRHFNFYVSAVAVAASIFAVVASIVRIAGGDWGAFYFINVPLFSLNAWYYGRRLWRWARGPAERRGVLP